MRKHIALALAGLGLSALTGCASVESTRRAEAAYPPVGAFVEAGGLRVHYVEAGEGPAVILIHGANGNLRDFTFSMVDELKDRYRVIVFDRPGHGYSDRAEPDGDVPATQARALAAAADALGVERAVIVGHSFGGAVAAAWALERPDQAAALVSLAGAVFPWNGDGGFLYSLAGSFMGPVVGAAARAYVSGSRLDRLIADVFAPNSVTPGYAEHIGVELALRPDTFRYNAADINELNDNLIPQAERYGELAMPVEIVHGESDATVGLDVHSIPFQAAAPEARLTVLPGVGHMPHHVSEGIVVAAIDRAARRAGLTGQ